jgi:hypothetical protein
LSFSSNTITKFAFHIFYLTIFFIIFWFNIKILNKNIYPRKWFYQKLYNKVDFFVHAQNSTARNTFGKVRHHRYVCSSPKETLSKVLFGHGERPQRWEWGQDELSSSCLTTLKIRIKGLATVYSVPWFFRRNAFRRSALHSTPST